MSEVPNCYKIMGERLSQNEPVKQFQCKRNILVWQSCIKIVYFAKIKGCFPHCMSFKMIDKSYIVLN